MGGELKMIKSNKEGYLQYLRQINDFNCIGLNSNIQILIQIDMMKKEVFRKIQIYQNNWKIGEISISDLYYQIEKDQFNQLINKIINDVKAISEYIKGQQLTQTLEDIIQKLQSDQVPDEWFKLGENNIKYFSIQLNKIFEKVISFLNGIVKNIIIQVILKILNIF